MKIRLWILVLVAPVGALALALWTVLGGRDRNAMYVPQIVERSAASLAEMDHGRLASYSETLLRELKQLSQLCLNASRAYEVTIFALWGIVLFLSVLLIIILRRAPSSP